MILVVGSTGIVGGNVCRRLLERGQPVRALVRHGSDVERIGELERLGAETFVGDLKDPDSIKSACDGANIVISTASGMLRHEEGDLIATVDRNGQLDLVSVAEEAGVKQFIYISFHDMTERFPLQDAKRAVENDLRLTRMSHTILQPTFFMEIWLSPIQGFDATRSRARIYGTGTHRIPWISLVDVAEFAVSAVENERAFNQTFELGGPDHLSPLEVVELFQKLGAPPFDMEFVSESDLRQQRKAATSAREKSLAGLRLAYSYGYEIDMGPALAAMPIELRSVEQYALRLVGSGAAIPSE